MTKNKVLHRFIFITYFIIVLVLHIIKANDLKDLNNYFLGIRVDHWMHAIMFLPLGFLVKFNFQRNGSIIIVSVIAGIFFEIVQYFLPYRTFELSDSLSDYTGIIIGLGLHYLLFEKREN